MTYKKFYYRSSSQKGFAEFEKAEKVECKDPHEDEYYIWNENKTCYTKCICSGWQV